MAYEELQKELKKLNSHQMEIFEDYIKEGWLESVAKVFCYIPQNRTEELLKDFPTDQQQKIKAFIEKFRSDKDSQILQILQILQVYDNNSGSEYEKVYKLFSETPASELNRLIDEELSGNPVLLSEIASKKRLFSYLLKLDDRAVQKILRETDTQDLAKALIPASEEIREKIFRNMSRRASDMLREDMEFLGPVRKADCIESQEKICRIILKLEESGEIVSPSSGKDDFVIQEAH